MYKTDLLEKNKQNLFKILEILYLDGNPVTKQSLTKKLKISPATLKRYLEDLNEDVQPLVDENKVEIKIEANTASFKILKNFALDDWLFDRYLKKSPKFQLVMLFYNHGSLTTYTLQEKLNLSEASLYRTIKQLNTVLSEFNLSIHNGNIIGDELQIRFFFYNLFQVINYSPKVRDFNLDQFVNEVQTELHFYFHSEAIHRVRLWLTISQHRLVVQSKLQTRIPESVRELYENNELYFHIKKVFQRVFHVRSQTKSEFESEAFCVMLISMSVFNSKTNVAQRFYDIYNSQHTRLSQVVDQTNHLIQKTLEIKDSQWPFELMKLVFDICARPFCFSGNLEYMDEIYADYYVSHFFSHQARQVVKEIMRVLTQSKYGEVSKLIEQNWIYFQRRLLFAVRDFRYQQIKDINIGVDTTFDYYISQLIIDLIRQMFKRDLRVNVNYYQPGNAYDLVLTNYHDEPYDDTDYTYWLTNLGTTRDLVAIKKIVETHFYEKTPVHQLMFKK